MNTRYGEFTDTQTQDYKTYLHNATLRLLKLKESQDANLNDYFIFLLMQISGMGSMCNNPSELLTMLTFLEGARLESLKGNCNYKIFRKAVLDSNALIDKFDR